MRPPTWAAVEKHNRPAWITQGEDESSFGGLDETLVQHSAGLVKRSIPQRIGIVVSGGEDLPEDWLKKLTAGDMVFVANTGEI